MRKNQTFYKQTELIQTLIESSQIKLLSDLCLRLRTYNTLYCYERLSNVMYEFFGIGREMIECLTYLITQRWNLKAKAMWTQTTLFTFFDRWRFMFGQIKRKKEIYFGANPSKWKGCIASQCFFISIIWLDTFRFNFFSLTLTII